MCVYGCISACVVLLYGCVNVCMVRVSVRVCFGCFVMCLYVWFCKCAMVSYMVLKVCVGFV